jgi:hypothetical protein
MRAAQRREEEPGNRTQRGDDAPRGDDARRAVA